MLISDSYRSLQAALFVATVFTLTACGGGASTSPAAVETLQAPGAGTAMSSYSAPGSNWEYDMNADGTFSISRSDFPGTPTNLSVDGSYSMTSSGFVSMTVSSSDGVDAPASGSSIWALEVPGYALFMSPVSTSEFDFIPMVVGGQCPGTDFSDNWITVRATASGDTTSPDFAYFGAMNYQHTNGDTSLMSQYALTSGNPDKGTLSLGTGYCRDGVVGTSTSDLYLAPEGSATIRANADDPDAEQMIFALPKKTIGAISGLDGSYIGVWADDGASQNQKVSPVMVTCTSGICTGDFISDVDSGAVTGQTFVVDLSGSTNVPGPGLTTGALQFNASDGSLGCMVDANLDGGGSRIISCAGQSPTRDYRLMNLILTSND